MESVINAVNEILFAICITYPPNLYFDKRKVRPSLGIRDNDTHNTHTPPSSTTELLSSTITKHFEYERSEKNRKKILFWENSNS